jgi:hypothetical protein
MANSTSVRTGLPAVMQDHLSDVLIDNLVDQMPTLYAIMAKDGNKEPGKSQGLGRPSSGAVFTGVPMPKVRRLEIVGTDKYLPIVATSLPSSSDSKWMGQYDTVPTVADWGNNSPTNALSRPVFKWAELATPILVGRKDLRRTMAGGQNPAARKSVGDLWTFAAEQALKQHLTLWNNVLFGTASIAPTSVDDNCWDKPYSIAAALSSTNNYAGVDRTLSANTWWQGNTVSTATTANLIDMVDYANYTGPGIAKKGRGIEFMVAPLALFPVFMAQARANNQLSVVDKIPELGNIGFRRPLVRYNNTYVICDPTCPATYVYGLDLSTWTVAFSQAANFSVGKIVDLSETAEQGKDALKSTIRTEAIIACEAPSRNIVWNNVTA